MIKIIYTSISNRSKHVVSIFALFFLCAILFVTSPAKAQVWAYDDGIDNPLYGLAYGPNSVLQRAKGALETLHGDIQLSLKGQQQVINGANQAVVDQEDRNSFAIPISQVNADAAVSPTSAVACTVYAGASRNGAQAATGNLTSSMGRLSSDSGKGSKAVGGGAAGAAGEICRRVGVNWSFIPVSNTGPYGALGDTAVKNCRQHL